MTDSTVRSIFDDATSHATYLSHDIQNELINIMGNQIREDISSMVSQGYSIICSHRRDDIESLYYF
jgi:hypothetical protein